MKILLVHNHYLQSGGEDAVFAAESALLDRHGHQVARYVEDNRRIEKIGRSAAAVRAVWSSPAKRRVLRLLRRELPDVAHFHNTFPLISPSAYYACRETGTPVIQTLHNFRLLCPNALFLRNGRVCEDCMGRPLPWPGIVHACYRKSLLQSAGVAAILGLHRLIGTWNGRVDLYIALSEFAREKFVMNGVPAEKIAVKPNFVHPDPGGNAGGGSYALFAGRLSEEKGIETLLDAWRTLKNIPLAVAGDGPLMGRVRALAESHPETGIRAYGRLPHEEVLRLMKSARFLVCPSLCYESFPMVIAEAFACGLPVVATDIGAVEELVVDRRTGRRFHAGDPSSLAEAVAWLWSHPEQARGMGREARREFETKYTAERNYELLLDIYSRAMRSR